MAIDAALREAYERNVAYKAYGRAYECLEMMYEDDPKACYKYIEAFRAEVTKAIEDTDGIEEKMKALKASYLLTAKDVFDDYCLYLEWDRPAKTRFYAPRRKQLRPITEALQDLADDKLDLLAISCPPGVGKALANDTPVLTRNGWKNHGDLVVGDEVIGLDGKFKKVIAVVPKCKLDVLVEFTNGEKIQCHERHEWLIHDRGIYNKAQQNHISETWRLERRKLHDGDGESKRGNRYPIQLPTRPHIVGEKKNIFDPYCFGVWLGDGANQNPRICNQKSDYAIIQRILDNGIVCTAKMEHKTTKVMYYDFNIRKELQKYGLCHSRRRIEKFIPQEYLTASIEQRLQLLAGLLDTDGTLVKSKYQFTTSEEKLRDTFVELVSTFGWRCCISKHEPSISSSGIRSTKPYYVVGFTPDMQIPCALKRKQNKEPHKQRAIGFKSITRVKPKEGNCITVEGDGMYLAGRTMLPTHNTTLAIFFLTWLGGKNPDDPILSGSHNMTFLDGLYRELVRIITPGGEYLWNDVFPDVKIVSTNADELRLDLGKAKRFATYQNSSIGSGNAGKVRAKQLIYCDDLIAGIEEAMNKVQLEKKWVQYTTDLRQRKMGKCKELHIATRWSVHDPIGHLIQEFEGNPRARFIAIPALNEQGESNFDYPYGLGFSKEYFENMRDLLDEASFKALYMNEPIEREGLLYNKGELRRYFELPTETPDAILAVCDTKERGVDYCCMPIVYQYGNDYYVVDILVDNSNPEVVEARIVNMLIANNVQMARFESNVAGGRIAEKIQQLVKERGGKCKITTKYTTANKETKIITRSPWVKERCLFKDDLYLTNNREYRKALDFLCSYTMAGKNKFDDVPDAFAQLADYCDTFVVQSITIVHRPF